MYNEMTTSKFALTAQNKEGAIAFFYGNTIKECIFNFEREFHRSGFIIKIHGNQESNHHYTKTIKKTHK